MGVLHLIVATALAGTPGAAGFGGVPLPAAELIFQIEAQRLPVSALASFVADANPDVRVRAVVAAGRLRAESDFFAGAAADSDPAVRLATATALGFVERSGPLIRARLAEETSAPVRAALIVALGRVGEPGDTPRFLAAMHTAQARQAVEALGRMGVRKVDGAGSDAVVAALLDTLAFPIGETRRIAAWALSRTTLVDISPAVAERLRVAATTDSDPRVRAWLVRAAAPVLKDPRFLATTSADPASPVRVAAVRAMAKHGCDAQALSARFHDTEAGVREEAITSASECAGIALDEVMAALDKGTPAERAAALRTLHALKALPAGLSEYQGDAWPLPVRMAAVEAMHERPKLQRIALHHLDPRLRSAAAGALLGGDEPPRANELVELLAATDPIVAQAAADGAREHPDPVLEKPLLSLLVRKELPRPVALSVVRALDALYATGRLPRPSADAAKVLRRWIESPELAEQAKRLAPLLGMENVRVRHPDRVLPSLAEVQKVRSARVFTERGEIRLELLPEVAPLTVWNFTTLAERGYFDGLSFHRVVPDFVIQTGDPRGDGWGGPGYEIPDELSEEPYSTGAVGMALSGPDTGGSQWFITLSPQPHLDFGYTVFGRVSLGMRSAEEVGLGDRIDRVVIERVP